MLIKSTDKRDRVSKPSSFKLDELLMSLRVYLPAPNPNHLSTIPLLLRIKLGGGLSLLILFIVSESRPQHETDSDQRSHQPACQSEPRHTERNHLSFDQVCTGFLLVTHMDNVGEATSLIKYSNQCLSFLV